MLKIYNIKEKQKFLREVSILTQKEGKKRGFKKLYLKTGLINYYEKFGAIFLDTLNNSEKLYYFNL
ncbi:MAG: hypothetical protein V8R30_06810 [Clostridia bacterium]